MEEEMKARVFLNGLSVVLVALVLSTCGGSPAPVSAPPVAQADPSPVPRADPQPVSAPVTQTVSPPDDLDAVIREASDYLNGKVPRGSKAVFLREVSDESAQSIGQMLGAQSIVSGTVSKIGSLYRVQIKAIEVQSAGVQGQWSRNIPSDATMAALTENYAPASGVAIVGQGKQNTQAIVAYMDQGGYTDWFLPSQAERGTCQLS
jgi:hypothetical protein